MRRVIGLGLAAGLLSGCSWFETEKVDPIFADLPMGPPSETLVESLPNDLPGATHETRHFRETFAPPDMLPEEDRPEGDTGSGPS